MIADHSVVHSINVGWLFPELWCFVYGCVADLQVFHLTYRRQRQRYIRDSYNLKQGVADIRSGAARVVMIGNSEAPVVSDVIDGYAAMGALATDQGLLQLDADRGLRSPDPRRAARPFRPSLIPT